MSKKLLLLGVDTSTRYAIEYAKSIGVYTIVTDFYTPEQRPQKLLADEYWMVDVADIDSLEARCRAEHVSGIYAGNNEFCLDQTKELTRRLGLPFYASDEGWACARDKGRFKEHCIAVGLDVPKRYPLTKPFDPDVLSSIEYPVIIKPLDSWAQQGLSLCRNEEELRAGFDLALSVSVRKEVIVEQYIDGDEVSAGYTFIGGKPFMHRVAEHLFTQYGGRNCFSMVTQQSKFTSDYAEKTGKKVEELFKRLNSNGGTAFLQAMYKDGKYYFLEVGYRLDAIGSWRNIKKMLGLDMVGATIDYQLGRDTSHWHDVIMAQQSNGVGCMYLPLCNPGKIRQIDGAEEVCAMDGVDMILANYHVGNEIKDLGNMRQIAYYLTIYAQDTASLIEKIKYINSTLRIVDENGVNLLIPFTNYDGLRVE